MDDITIIYLDQEVVIPGLRCEVLERQNRYLALAEKAEKKFLQKYYDKYGDFFVFANKYAEDVSDFLRPYYKSMIHELVECGIYDASIDGIFQKYGEFLAKSLLELQNGIKDLCNRASDGMETAMAVRELRKATRTQMVGGGFGLTGALAGMAVSGAYNTVSGLLHSGANAIGNSRTRLKINEKFQNLYKSADFRELVGKCIWDSVFSIKYVIEDCLGHVEVIPDSEYKSKAKALRSNFPRIPDDDKHEVVQEILTLAPDDLETYKLLLPQYGDPNGDLRRIIQIVAPQKLTEFDDLRKELFLKSNNSVYRVIDEEIGKLRAGEFLGEKQTAIKNRTDADIVENARKLGYAPNEKTTIKEIGSATEYMLTTCSNLDIKSRTAFGVTYDTYDLAQKAIQNRKTCEHQWQYTITQSYPELCETLKQFQELNKTAPQGSVSDFVEKASAKEKKFRTINDVVYETYEIAQKAASNRSIAGQFLRQCSNANPFDLQDALQKVKSLNQEIPEGAVSDYIDKISEIEVATRTVNDVLYDTFELAEKARANRRDGEKLVQESSFLQSHINSTDTVKFHSAALGEYSKIIEYFFPVDYSFLKLNFPGSWDDIIQKCKDPSEKWLIFVSSKDEGRLLKGKIKDSEFVDASTKNIHPDLIAELVNSEMFRPKVLITTSTLDNGINFSDKALKNIVIDTIDQVQAKQMLGRKRRSDQETVNLYVMQKLENQIEEYSFTAQKSKNILLTFRNNPWEFYTKFWGELSENQQQLFGLTLLFNPNTNTNTLSLYTNDYASWQLERFIGDCEMIKVRFVREGSMAFIKEVCDWFGLQYDPEMGESLFEIIKEKVLNFLLPYVKQPTMDKTKLATFVNQLIAICIPILAQINKKTKIYDDVDHYKSDVNNIFKFFSVPYLCDKLKKKETGGKELWKIIEVTNPPSDSDDDDVEE